MCGISGVISLEKEKSISPETFVTVNDEMHCVGLMEKAFYLLEDLMGILEVI